MATNFLPSLRKLALVGAFLVVRQDVRISVSRYQFRKGIVVAVALERASASGKWSIDNEYAFECTVEDYDHAASFWEVNTIDFIHRTVTGSVLPMNHSSYEPPK